jgi:hypothetical protein
MPSFRPGLLHDRNPLSPGDVGPLCADLISPAHFFAADALALRWEYRREDEVFWEVFHGRALDRSQTRRRQRFETWGIYDVAPDGSLSDEPVLGIRFDGRQALFVTRAVLCRGYESVSTEGKVIEARPTVRWQRELVAAIDLHRYSTRGELADELACLLFQAVVGVSRLPLTSLEAPLPAFSLGRLGYCYRPTAGTARCQPLSAPPELLDILVDPTLACVELVKLCELFLRAARAADLAPAVPALLSASPPSDPFWLLTEVFNAATLSPYTDFVRNALAVPRLAHAAGHVSAEAVADFHTRLLRLLARHLTAYDLVTFHHRGANYPDALLLDELLGELRPLLAREPDLFDSTAGLRRRGVRHGLLARAEYQGHPVPDAPTSPGENVRVLPKPFRDVPEDQIFASTARRRRLFVDDGPGDYGWLRDLLGDLDDPRELRELGTALFLDRPFGALKQPGEPDRTLMLAHVLFSRSVAARRLRWLAERPRLLPDPRAADRWLAALELLPEEGLVLRDAGPPPRPGVVSLHDAFLVADDWAMLRTARRSIGELCQHYDFTVLQSRLRRDLASPENWRLVVPVRAAGAWALRIYDNRFRPLFDVLPDYAEGYYCRGGVEVVAAGLRVVAVADGTELIATGRDSPLIRLKEN